MLQLKNADPIGSGVDRIVYPHPHDSDLCIKIGRCNFTTDYQVRGFRDSLYYVLRFFNKNHFDFNFIDVRYASKLAKRGGTDIFRHIPKCHGFVETDMGRGVLWQRIRDFDGSVCVTLKDCYYTPGLLGVNEKERLWHALEEFCDWQKKHAVMLREMAFVNTIVCRLDQENIRFYHVDAIGCVDLIPLANYAKWFAKMRIWSKVRRFRKSLAKWLKEQDHSN